MSYQRRPTEQYHLKWRGIDIIVAYTPDWFSDTGSTFHRCHLEVMSEQPGIPLSITETGYRSLDLPGGAVENGGGPVEYALRWLDHAAQSKDWKAAERDQRQGRLF